MDIKRLVKRYGLQIASINGIMIAIGILMIAKYGEPLPGIVIMIIGVLVFKINSDLIADREFLGKKLIRRLRNK